MFGDVFVMEAGEVVKEHPELAAVLLPGSLWDLTGKPVHNGYTTLGFRDYNFRFCIRYNGDVCPSALREMFKTEPVTGLPWVDLHSISTLVLVDLPGDRMEDPPPGWHEASREDHVVTWVRDQVLPTAGGVVWTSPGPAYTRSGRPRPAPPSSWTVWTAPTPASCSAGSPGRATWWTGPTLPHPWAGTCCASASRRTTWAPP